MTTFRYSLRWLLVLVAVVALVLSLAAHQGSHVIAWVVETLLRGIVPSMALVGSAFARSDWRAFSLGVLVAGLPLVMGADIPVHGILNAATTIAVQFLNCLLCGAVAVACRRWLSQRGLANDL